MAVDPDVPELPPIPMVIHMHDPVSNTSQVVETEILPEEDFPGFSVDFPWSEQDGTTRNIVLRYDGQIAHEMAFEEAGVEVHEELPSAP